MSAEVTKENKAIAQEDVARHSSFFGKFLCLLLCACILTVVLTAMIYTVTGGNVFARRIADEMLPRAQAIARLASRFQTGQISYDSFIDISLNEQRGTRVYIFDVTGEILAYVASDYDAVISERVLTAGLTAIGENRDYVSAKWSKVDGVVVGVPFTDNMNRVCGAVVMSRPANVLLPSMFSLIRALMASCLIASIVMIVPAYYVSGRMSNPIRSMMRASVAMASGDFTVRADEDRSDEIGQLGAALNFLSERLNRNIADLLLTRNRLHMILDGLSEGVVALDHENKPIYVNHAARALLGAGEREAISPHLAAALPLCDAVLAEGAACTRETILDKGEKKLHIAVSYSQETSESAAGTIIVVRDVTAEERLEQTRRDYVANVSHELRTPIASIRSIAETLNDGLIRNEDDRSRYYGYILRESMRLSRLINDLLELSRLQSGAIALEKKPFDLIGVASEVAERMGVVAAYSDIRINTAFHGLTRLTVCSNRDRIEQTLIALTDNAIKFSKDDGAILFDVRLDEAHAYAEVSVRNTGHIDEAVLPHLFERFYKADTSHTEGGTGLGLAIVYEVLARLGETIRAYNEGDDAVFTFTVALCDEPKA